jgi:predicted NAD-dependent protein-ADP-ribosyltransferase YbiA (DUF1768 family)
LFWAIGYVAEGGEINRSRARDLREVCAMDVCNDPDPATRALLLGMDSVEEYATWIRNEFHWGGENEIVALAKHYNLEIAVVNCESLRVMCYGGQTGFARVYILYTGQHYDPLVLVPNVEATVAEQTTRFTKGDTSLDAESLDLARKHLAEAARKASERRVKRIKCKGCNAVCDDATAFATHCAERDHGDDFAYDCEEVEVVIEGDLPQGLVDLSSDSVHTFYEIEAEPLAKSYPAVTHVDGRSYPTLEHFWRSAPFSGNEELVSRIVACKTVHDAIIESHAHEEPVEWREVRRERLLVAQRAKFAQHPDLARVLLATGDKTIACVDTDAWAGMQSQDGIPTGSNNVGLVLMTIRQELREGHMTTAL